ncbi:MAG: superoxide dismutase [Phycisphaerales bacterium]|nr:superoxide dismutase [Phycisphaerales bacterium]
MSNQITRRQAIALTTVAAGAVLAAPRLASARSRAIGLWREAGLDLQQAGEFTLPPLPYANNALEPHIDAETMEIHHDRHHKAYIDNANKALAGTQYADMTSDRILGLLDETPDDKKTAIRNNVGGHVNHSMFWLLMAPTGKGGGGEPTGALADAIKQAFGSYGDKGGFKDQFAEVATKRFGSGWAWLIAGDGGKLKIVSTANQDSPLMAEKFAGPGAAGTPILGLDVWEHAYYLKYRNKRADYITAFWNVVNWTRAAQLHTGTMGAHEIGK